MATDTCPNVLYDSILATSVSASAGTQYEVMDNVRVNLDEQPRTAPIQKVNGVYSSSLTHLAAMECQRPYGITVSPATRHKLTHPALTPAR